MAESEREKACRSLASMLHKCEKSQAKLTQGVWQWELMDDTIRALRVALLFLEDSPEVKTIAREEKEAALLILSSSIDRVEKAQLKLSVGTSLATLATNRIDALRLASALIAKGAHLDVG